MFRHIVTLLLAGAACAGPLRAADRPLVIDPAQSRVEVAVKATMDSFTGKLARYDPSIMVTDDGRIAAARVAFHFRDVLTGKDKRDAAMHKWQQTDTYPDGEFVLSSLEKSTDGTHTAFGRLTLHGISRDIRFPVTIARAGEQFAVDGDAPVDTREFGLPIIRVLGMLKVDPLVHVKFHLQGHPAS